MGPGARAMQLLEIVLQGVGRFPPSLKTTFKPGYNVILGASRSGKTTFFEALLSILLGRNPGVGITPADLPPGQPSRGGVTVREGNMVYRLMKDFRSGTLLLSRLNPSTSKFDPLLRGWGPIEDFLKKELAFPSMSAFEALYTLTPRALPSSTPPPPAVSAPAPEPPPVPVAPPTLAEAGSFRFDDDEPAQEETPEMLAARLTRLKAEFAHSEEIERLEFELGGIQSRVFELEKKIGELDDVEKEVQKVEEEMKQYKFFADLPEGIEAKIASYRKVNEQRMREVGQLEFENDELTRHIRALGSEPFYKEKNFIAGAAVAGGCLIASQVIAAIIGPSGNYLLLGSFVGLVMVLYVAWHDFGKKDLVKTLQDKIQARKDKIAQVEKRFEIEGGVVKNLLRMTRLDAPEDLKLEMENYKSLGIDEKWKGVQAKKQALLQKGDRATYVKERDEIKAKVKGLEERLRALGASAKDTNELRREIKEIEKKLKQKGVQAPQPAAPQVQAASPAPDGPLAEVFRNGRGMLMMDPPSFKASLREKFLSTFSSLTTQAYTLENFEENGSIAFFSSGLGRRVTFPELPPALQDIVYISFALSVLEMISEKWKGPVILDNPFASLDEGVLMGIGQSLKKLSLLTQVIHLSSKGGFATTADNTVSLG